MKRRIPVASAKRQTNYVTIEGVTTYSHNIRAGAINYVPSKKPVIGEITPLYRKSINKRIHQVREDRSIEKILLATGMNPHYSDTLKNPFAE